MTDSTTDYRGTIKQGGDNRGQKTGSQEHLTDGMQRAARVRKADCRYMEKTK